VNCSEVYTKYINALCGQNVEFLNVKPGGTYVTARPSDVNGTTSGTCNYHWVLKAKFKVIFARPSTLYKFYRNSSTMCYHSLLLHIVSGPCSNCHSPHTSSHMLLLLIVAN
jgi:hypothetical protein